MVYMLAWAAPDAPVDEKSLLLAGNGLLKASVEVGTASMSSRSSW